VKQPHLLLCRSRSKQPRCKSPAKTQTYPRRSCKSIRRFIRVNQVGLHQPWRIPWRVSGIIFGCARLRSFTVELPSADQTTDRWFGGGHLWYAHFNHLIGEESDHIAPKFAARPECLRPPEPLLAPRTPTSNETILNHPPLNPDLLNRRSYKIRLEDERFSPELSRRRGTTARPRTSHSC